MQTGVRVQARGVFSRDPVPRAVRRGHRRGYWSACSGFCGPLSATDAAGGSCSVCLRARPSEHLRTQLPGKPCLSQGGPGCQQQTNNSGGHAAQAGARLWAPASRGPYTRATQWSHLGNAGEAGELGFSKFSSACSWGRVQLALAGRQQRCGSSNQAAC